ncbi:hypothetical protein [[Phormidium] sp. ETS-05]|nr:hypothetical protein [[Phormidium] sp. ETS-05]
MTGRNVHQSKKVVAPGRSAQKCPPFFPDYHVTGEMRGASPY